MTTRFGRALSLNGDDEFAFILDGDITPSDAFDVPGGDITFGLFFKLGYGSLGNRRTLMGKRADTDETVSNAGWYIEKDADDFLRLFLDDGSSTFELLSDNPITDDGFYHTLIVTIDFSGGTQQAEMWLSEGKQPTMGIRSVGTLDLSTVGSMANSERFTIGGVATSSSAAENLFYGSIAWAAVWDERLPEDYIRGPVSRFQLPGKDDRRVIGLWHFTNMSLDDWNRGTQNDLVGVGLTLDVPSPNFPPGPERFPEIDGYSIAPSLGAQPAQASIGFARFRPEVLSEGFFKQIGLAGAPPMEIRKMTATIGTIGSSGHCTNYGRYFSTAKRSTGADNDVWFYYRIEPTLDPANPEPGLLTPIGKIDNDGEFRNSIEHWAQDRPGEPTHLFGWASASGGGTERFLIVDVRDPTTPVKRATLSGVTGPRQLIYDPRNPVSGADYVHLLNQATGVFQSVDVTDLDAPSLARSTTQLLMDDGLGRFVQIGAFIYTAADNGLGGLDVTDPLTVDTGDNFVTLSPASPPHDLLATINITATGNVVCVGQDDAGDAIYTLFDVSSNPSVPVLLARVSLPAMDPATAHVAWIEGNILYVGVQPGSDTRLFAFSIADETNPQHLATYDLSDYVGGAMFSGVETVLSFDRKALCWQSIAGPDTDGYFWLDPGEEFSALDIAFEIPDMAIDNPTPIQEIETIIHDLSQLDFEDDALGTDPPAGWTKTGSASAVWEISEVRGLTGQVPGAAQLPRSLHVSDTGGPFTNKNLQFDIPIPVALRVQGTPFRFEGYYLIRGPGSIAAVDLTFRFEETGGVSTGTTDVDAPFIEKDRWHKFEVDHVLTFDDSTNIRIQFLTQNTVIEDIYFDSVRVGPTRKPLSFAGRVMTVTGAEERADLIADEYSVQMADRTWDLNRLKVSTSLPAQAATVSLISLITDFTRGQDAFSTNNVFPELGAHDLISLQSQDNLAMAIARVIESVDVPAIWWVDYFGDLHALPVAYLIAPKPVNDVAVGWEQLEDTEDGAEMVTEGTVEGDQAALPVPSGSFTNSENLSRFGQIQYFFPPTSDISTDAQAQDVADSYRDLLGDRQFEGRVKFLDEPRFQPGQILPIQVDVRGLDRAVQIDSVHFTPQGNRVSVVLAYKLLQSSFTDEALRDRIDAGNQDVGTMGFDNPLFGFDVDPAMGFDAVS